MSDTSKFRVGRPSSGQEAHSDICLPGAEAYFESVCEGTARGYRALTCADRSIHVGCAIHVKPVEVQACALVTELIVDIDHNTVSYSSSDLRNRPLPVDSNGRTLKSTIGVGYDPSDVEIIGNSSARNKDADVEENDKIFREHIQL